MFVLRFAVGAVMTEERHVNEAWKVIQDHASVCLAEESTQCLVMNGIAKENGEANGGTWSEDTTHKMGKKAWGSYLKGKVA